MSQPNRIQRSPVESRSARREGVGDLSAAPRAAKQGKADAARPALGEVKRAKAASAQPDRAAKTKQAAAKKHIDYVMLIILVALVFFGLVTVYSASYYTLQASGENPYSTVLKQGFIAAMGFFAMFTLMKVDYHVWYNPKIIGLGVAVSLALLVLVLIPGIGVLANGSRRWINIPVIGLSIQPGEIAKVLIIFYLAKSLADNAADLVTFKGFLRHLIIPVAMFGLIMIQPNLSTAGSLIILSLCMLIAGGARWKHLGLLIAAGLIAAFLLTYFEGYRMRRLMNFLDPFNPDQLQGDGYQLYQSLLALGSGGLFGTGPGMSRQKALYLPYGDSDFIFSVFAEEYGWVGCVALLTAYGVFIRQGIVTAMRAPDRFGSMLATGLTMMIAVQVSINIAVASGTMPTTGLPLPFFSAGGTNLLVYLTAMGVLLNISKQSGSVKRA